MTNLYGKAVIFSIAALAVTLSGCKKEDEFGTFVLDQASVDFEWGQTKEVGFTAKHIKAYNILSVPEGWTCVRDGFKYIITSPAQGAPDAEPSGKIELRNTSSNDAGIARSISVTIRIASEITSPPANSIIVSEPGRRYKFYARRRGNESSGTSLSAAIAATRVWSTSKTAVSNVSLEGDYLYFATGEGEKLEEGNAVVAVTDAQGTILWSWHIWATDFDPAADPDVMGGFEVMNRNLGALANSNATPEDVVRSYGLYYQWGRKDPFVGPVEWNSTAPQPLYNKSNTYTLHTFAASDSETGTVGYAIAHPGTFIAGAGDNNFNWIFTGNDRGLWDGSGANAASGPKTIYDPCPAGWRVASREVFESLVREGGVTTAPEDYNIVGGYDHGWTFSVGDRDIFFPAAGRRSFSPSLASSSRNYTNIVNDEHGEGLPVGFYWYSDDVNSFAFGSDFIDYTLRMTTPVEQQARAGGFPLRCVAE